MGAEPYYYQQQQQQLEAKGWFLRVEYSSIVRSSRHDSSLSSYYSLDVANFRASVESEIIELCWIANLRGTRSFSRLRRRRLRRTQQAAPAANPDCMQNCLKFNKTGGGLETDGQRLAGSLTDCCPRLAARAGRCGRRAERGGALWLAKTAACAAAGWGGERQI
jgi:hypothetical protein